AALVAAPEQHRAAQVRGLDVVEVDEEQPADPREGKVHGAGVAEGAHPGDHHARPGEALLIPAADQGLPGERGRVGADHRLITTWMSTRRSGRGSAVAPVRGSGNATRRRIGKRAECARYHSDA